MIHVFPWLFIIARCSGPLMIVPRTTASLFTKFGKILWLCQLQENNPKILEYFEFATSSDKLLIQQKKNSCVAGGFKMMYLPPISKELRDAFRTMSSI